ncbi:hypothetical protein [Streptomyces sp. NPDC020681]|uniref:hypothetical protein n=1 Tax=Streptomyces sp. NPDC020681 TaxID=3365083 RepID=UPI003792326E
MGQERQSTAETALGAGLAEAAEGVRIVPVPTAAVMAGGRRRRARRRAAVAALAVAALLPAGGFAVGAAMDDKGTRSADGVAARPTVPGLLTPVTVTVATLKYPDGAVRKAQVTVYGAPRTKEESLRQLKFAEQRGDVPRGWSEGVEKRAKSGDARELLIGQNWYVIHYAEGKKRQLLSGPERDGRERHEDSSNTETIRGKYVGVWVGAVGSLYSAVEIGWGPQPKVRPRLVSVPGIDVRFYAAAIPENPGRLHFAYYDKEGKVVAQR